MKLKHNEPFPPTLETVQTLARSNRKPIQFANSFFAHYEARQWLSHKRKPLPNWRTELTRWIARKEKEALKTGY